MDIDSIPFGLDFREHVKTALLENDILIAVIGSKWIGADSKNRSRIKEETDPVRIELETALKRNIPVVPVLVGGARMPTPAELPDGLKDLAFRNAAQIDAGRDFHQHMERLIRSMDRILELKTGGATVAKSEISGPSKITAAVRKNVEHVPSSAVLTQPGAAAATGFVNSMLAKCGICFSDAETEKEFLADYRERYYSLGQSAIGISLAGWLFFGSIALVASQGNDFVAIRFFFVAAPILLIVFFSGFSKLAKQMWQAYYAMAVLVFLALAYVSARLLQGESWFRPEYVTMTVMAGIAVIGMAPVLVLYAVLLQSLMLAVALYYFLFDLHVAEFPTLYTIFSSLFLGVTLVIGACFAFIRERAVRREFAALRALGRAKRV